MYNTKIVKFSSSTQTRYYSTPVLSGQERKDMIAYNKQALVDRRRLELDIMSYYGHSLPDFISEDDYLSLSDIGYSSWSDDKRASFIKSISENRSKKVIYNICRANTWDYFITLTFNQKEFDSSDYDLCVKRVGKWLNHLRRKAPDLKYIIVPELHKDNIHYHFHGLLANCGNISFVESGHFTPNGDIIYNIENYKFGFSTATKVKSTDRVSGYITKYITKELDNHLKGKRRYMASLNCEKPEVIDLNFSVNDFREYLQNLDNITYMASKQNFYNTVSYIESK